MSNSLGSKLREIDARRKKSRRRNTSSVWIIAVGRKRSTSPLSDTCPKHVVARRRREWIVRCTRYRLSLDLRVLARLETNRRRYVRLEEIARKTGLSPRYRSSCTRRPIYSLSLSLSRGSAVDLREMEEQGSDFHRRTSVQYSLGQGRRGGSARWQRDASPRNFYFSSREMETPSGISRAPSVSSEGAVGCVDGESNSLSLSLVWRKISNFIPRREMKRKSLFRELKRIKERNFENR